MSQYPPTMTPPPPGYYAEGPHGMPHQPRTSAAAVTSLIFGILGCIPVLSQLLAIICGIVGIRATRSPNVTGRGMAIAGLVLGLLWTALLGLGGVGAGVAYMQTKPARAVARQYLVDVSSGNLQAAQAASAPGVTPQSIQALADTMKTNGTFSDITFFGFNVNYGTQASTTLTGVAYFSGGPKGAVIKLVRVNGAERVESVQFQ